MEAWPGAPKVAVRAEDDSKGRALCRRVATARRLRFLPSASIYRRSGELGDTRRRGRQTESPALHRDAEQLQTNVDLKQIPCTGPSAFGWRRCSHDDLRCRGLS